MLLFMQPGRPPLSKTGTSLPYRPYHKRRGKSGGNRRINSRSETRADGPLLLKTGPRLPDGILDQAVEGKKEGEADDRSPWRFLRRDGVNCGASPSGVRA